MMKVQVVVLLVLLGYAHGINQDGEDRKTISETLFI